MINIENSGSRSCGDNSGFVSTGVMAAGFKPAPPAGQLGAVIVDPYGNAPLTALVDLDSHVISDVKVTVHGKGEKGVRNQLSRGSGITKNL